MTNIIIADLEAIIAKIKGSPIIQTVETDIKSAGSATLSYIEANGLQDAYQIALNVVLPMIGTPWTGVLAAVRTAIIADGKILLTGAESILASQAQADLIALGKVVPSV